MLGGDKGEVKKGEEKENDEKRKEEWWCQWRGGLRHRRVKAVRVERDN